jgi:hypothetical protein
MDGIINSENKVGNSTLRGLFKLVYTIVLLSLMSAPVVYLTKLKFFPSSKKNTQVIASYPFRSVNMQGLGWVSEPIIDMKLKIGENYEDYEFLVDSGAAVSSMPYEMAEVLDYNLAFMPRLTFRGFGNTTSFAYQGDMVLNVGGQDLSVPVVFTESKGSKFLLGRKGFFDSYTIAFNHRNKVIEIAK